MLGGEDLALPCPWIMRNLITVRGQWMYDTAAIPGLMGVVRGGAAGPRPLGSDGVSPERGQRRRRARGRQRRAVQADGAQAVVAGSRGEFEPDPLNVRVVSEVAARGCLSAEMHFRSRCYRPPIPRRGGRGGCGRRGCVSRSRVSLGGLLRGPQSGSVLHGRSRPHPVLMTAHTPRSDGARKTRQQPMFRDDPPLRVGRPKQHIGFSLSTSARCTALDASSRRSPMHQHSP